jgi:16S rRNA (cytosine1402-N4)-methyltransferase
MYQHIPVLLEETINALEIRPDGRYVDCTAGGGGHSLAMLSKLGKDGLLIAIDRDECAVKETSKVLASSSSDAGFDVVQAQFSALKSILAERQVDRVDGLVADLGVSSAQIDDRSRGYSYHGDGPLDMRMDQRQQLTAKDVINGYQEEDLARLMREYGEERYAGKIASAIVSARRQKAIETTGELANIVIRAMPAASRREKQHPARRVFQSVRMEVNDELGELKRLLRAVPDVMADQGKVAMISFHSLEDRIVKQTFLDWQNPCHCPSALPCICGKKPLGRVEEKRGKIASAAERQKNPRAASARLRVFAFEGR